MIAPATKSTLKVSCASRNGSLKPMMLKAAESRVCRYETTWAIARPPSELSSGMNGDPVCATPCTASYSAPRTTRAESRNASAVRSEEHTSELQSLAYLVCRLLLEK